MINYAFIRTITSRVKRTNRKNSKFNIDVAYKVYGHKVFIVIPIETRPDEMTQCQNTTLNYSRVRSAFKNERV